MKALGAVRASAGGEKVTATLDSFAAILSRLGSAQSAGAFTEVVHARVQEDVDDASVAALGMQPAAPVPAHRTHTPSKSGDWLLGTCVANGAPLVLQRLRLDTVAPCDPCFCLQAQGPDRSWSSPTVKGKCCKSLADGLGVGLEVVCAWVRVRPCMAPGTVFHGARPSPPP